jgi:hypothetical protein
MRGASVTGHAGRCHTELGVLGGYWPARDGDRLLQARDRRDVIVGSVLCVPKTSSTSCDQAIFVDQTTDASLFSDAVLVEIDWLG